MPKILFFLFSLSFLAACKTPIAGPLSAITQAESKADFLAKRAQQRGVSIAEQGAWDQKQGAESDLKFNLGDLATATEARSLYKTHCSGCHGRRGEGISAAVSYPALGGLSYRMGMMMSGGKMGRGIYRLIHDGRDIMPTFKDRLANEQIWLLVSFLETL
jgi:mono/diheme cytochrome c family protein